MNDNQYGVVMTTLAALALALLFVAGRASYSSDLAFDCTHYGKHQMRDGKWINCGEPK